MKVMMATSWSNHLHAILICDHCGEPIINPMDAHLVWPDADDDGCAETALVHPHCHQPYEWAAGRGLHHWGEMADLADLLRGEQ